MLYSGRLCDKWYPSARQAKALSKIALIMDLASRVSAQGRPYNQIRSPCFLNWYRQEHRSPKVVESLGRRNG